MDIPRFHAKPRFADRCGISNSPQLALLGINSVLVEGPFGPPHDVLHLLEVDG